MTDHADLVGLLRGELTNAEVMEVDAHLGTCDECRVALASVATGHALLASTTRTLRAPRPAEVPVAPQMTARPPRRWRGPVALAAAAVLVVLGAVTVPTLLDDDRPPTAERQSAPLEPVEGAGGGEVVMTSKDDAVGMTITTRGLPQVGDGDYYYAWLFDPSTEKMLALGVINPDGTASFDLPSDIVGRYQVVDVSLEQDDGDPSHSVTSVLRADYSGSDASDRALSPKYVQGRASGTVERKAER
ncbi:anti-sigma factor [Mumia zhuanghuii]|uniref:Anti-sigma factor domain-containing protein n=2 Tax=Mumia TaxID=1546255 RepID=A0ABW1QKS8_9ACTN|nr:MULTISPECIES: anti-sigma factor [Mumia]KAA1418233.1 anti-sigma factor [Mumia zhuanghuii]